MVEVKRLLRHAFADPFARQRHFPASTLARLESVIADSEAGHSGELRFAIEATLPLRAVVRGQTARERALEVFSQLRVWDTEANTGVLVYLLLAERDLEIVADRGLSSRVDPAAWEAIAQGMESAFRAGNYEAGACDGIRRIGALLALHAPQAGHNPDELPNRPVLAG